MSAESPSAAPLVSAGRRSHAERSRATRAHLIATTIDVLGRHSYHGATVFEVAKAAGLTHGALQHHFGSKAALMMAVTAEILRSGDATGVRWPSPQLPLTERAERFVQALWRRLYEPPRFLAAWSIYFGGAAEPEVRATVAAQRAELSETLHKRFAEVFPELAGAADLGARVDLVLSALRGMAVARLFGPAPRETAAQLRVLAALIAAQVQPAPARPAPAPRSAPPTNPPDPTASRRHRRTR